MTRRRDLKRLVRNRMKATGEPYTAALSAIRGPDVPARPTEQGAPAMGRPEPEPTDRDSTSDATSIPVLPARDIPETLALFAHLGFTVRHDEENAYGMVRRGSIELHYTATPDLDPWSGAGMAFVRLRDVTALYGEFRAAHVVPLVALPRSELRHADRVREELKAKWAAGESIARMGELADQPWGIREFPLLDANNNLIRFGQILR